MSVHRLFFALWPDEAVRAQTAEVADAFLGNYLGKRVPAQNYHITLAFLGNVTDTQMVCAIKAGDTLSGAPFELSLDRLGFFPKAHVVWLGTETCPPEALALHEQFRTVLPACGWLPEARPFHPHLTLLRKALSGPAASLPASIRWPVHDFVLVESQATSEGALYEVRRRWALTGGS